MYDGGIVGEKAISRMLLQNNVLKERKDGQNRVVDKFDVEESRVKSIERVWGIKFEDEE